MTGKEAAGFEIGPRDLTASRALGLGILLLYALSFASVPTSDGLSFIRMVDSAIASGGKRLPVISNAPFSYYLAFFLKRACVAAHLNVPTLWVFQCLNALVAACGAALFYRTIRLFGGAPFWAFTAAMLVMTSYGVWYFANGEVHHVGLAILLLLFYRVAALRRETEGPVPYARLIGLGLLNAIAVFFHQEHFLFGLAVVALLMVGRPWRRGLRESAVYALAGSAWTFLIIFLVGRFLVGARTLRDIGAWYFWQLGYLVREYEPEPARIIAARLVKGQLTAFVYGAQAIVDALRGRVSWDDGVVRVLSTLTVLALLVAAVLAADAWRERRRLTDDLRALAAGAIVWLLAYPVLLSWYFPAVTEYYLKTVPPLVLVLVVGPIARERAGLTSWWLRAMAVTLLVLVVAVNGASAIVPWYRYGLMRERIGSAAASMFRPGDLAISTESGLDAVLEGRVEQLSMKNLLYREGKVRGFAAVQAEVDARLRAGRRVVLYNTAPGRWALEGLNAPDRNPYRDRYDARDFEALLDGLRARYDLVPVLAYWEEAKEPLYLFGRRLEPVLEVRKR
ncbi:MAG TPA: hypothetical protein VF948_07720 [Methylomirabilota bacterium]